MTAPWMIVWLSWGIWTLPDQPNGRKFLQPQSFTALGLFQNGQDLQDLEGFPPEGVKKKNLRLFGGQREEMSSREVTSMALNEWPTLYNKYRSLS